MLYLTVFSIALYALSSTFLLCPRLKLRLSRSLHKIHRGWYRETRMHAVTVSQGLLVLFLFVLLCNSLMFIYIYISCLLVCCHIAVRCYAGGREPPSVDSGAVCVELAADSFTHMSSKTAMERARLADEWMKREVKLRPGTIFAWTEGCSLRHRPPLYLAMHAASSIFQVCICALSFS
jgi:hypothetical protein